jgi:hypothetical protein
MIEATARGVISVPRMTSFGEQLSIEGKKVVGQMPHRFMNYERVLSFSKAPPHPVRLPAHEIHKGLLLTATLVFVQ